MKSKKPVRRKKIAPALLTSDKAAHSGPGKNWQSNVSLAPLTPEQAVRGIFAIPPAEVKKIVASKPGKKKG